MNQEIETKSGDGDWDTPLVFKHYPDWECEVENKTQTETSTEIYVAPYDDTVSSTQDLWLAESLDAVFPKTYEIDFDKVKSPEDLLKVMMTLQVWVSDQNPCFEQVKQFCKGIENG